MARSYRSPVYEIRVSRIHGRGAYSLEPIRKGEILAIRSGSVVNYDEARRRDSTLGGFSMHVERGFFLCPDDLDNVDEIGVFFNHSCQPNVGIRNQITFVALRDISADEELTFDYATNVSFPFSFSCTCGSLDCRRIITGNDWLLPELQDRYSGHFDAVITNYLSSTSGAVPEREAPNIVPFEGPVYNRIRASLSGFSIFDAWRDGMISRRTYEEHLDEIFNLPKTVPLNENERALSSRLWWRPGDCVDSTLLALMDQGAITQIAYDRAKFLRFRSLVEQHWSHANRSTYIFPEEAQLVYALSECIRPRRIAVIGSFYGYWAAFAIAGAWEGLESAVLIDKDAEVCRLAETNLKRLGKAKKACVEPMDAFDFFRQEHEPFDMVLLDAECPRGSGDPRLRGKAVYAPLLEVSLPYILKKSGYLIARNMLIDSDCSHSYFTTVVDRNTSELSPFIRLAGDSFTGSHLVDSTEGVGIYWR